VFGDHEQGMVWTIDVNATRDGMVASSQKDFANTNNIRALRMGTDNALYMVEGNGRVNRVTAKGTTTTPSSCPSVNGPDDPVGMGGSAGTGNGAGSGNIAGNATAGAGVTGGSSSTAGTSAGGTSNAGTAGTPGDSDSCACRTVGGGRASLFGLGALGAALALAWSRRRRRG
jgi:MYXO-CTERM domain-containing protein